MKVLVEAGVIVMTPENAGDHAAMHQMKVCGVKAMTMMNSSPAVHGEGLRGPLVVETWPEGHGLPGSLARAAGDQSPS